MAFSVRPCGPARLRMRAAPRPGDVPPARGPRLTAPRPGPVRPGRALRAAHVTSAPRAGRGPRRARRAGRRLGLTRSHQGDGAETSSSAPALTASRLPGPRGSRCAATRPPRRAPAAGPRLGPTRRPPARGHVTTPRGRGGDYSSAPACPTKSAAGTAWVPLRRHVTAAPRAGGGPRLGPPRRSPARDHAITPRGRGGDCSSAPACPTKSAAGIPWVSLCRHVTSAPRAGRGPRWARCAGCRLGVTCLNHGVRGGDESSAPAFLAASTCCGSAGRATGVAPRLGWAGRHTWAVQPAICNRPSWDKQVPPNECHDGAHCVTGQR
jgi:hypothetical protein